MTAAASAAAPNVPPPPHSTQSHRDPRGYGSCSTCGQVLSPNARFCGACGQASKPHASSQSDAGFGAVPPNSRANGAGSRPPRATPPNPSGFGAAFGNGGLGAGLGFCLVMVLFAGKRSEDDESDLRDLMKTLRPQVLDPRPVDPIMVYSVEQELISA